MKIIKTLIFIAVLSFIVYINLEVYGAINDSWIDKIANHFIWFYSVEGLILLILTHVKSYTFGQKRLLAKGKKKKDIKEALNELNKENENDKEIN